MPLPIPFADDAVALLADLVRIDTSNPPGREEAAATLLADLLQKDGYPPNLLEAAKGRTNLVVRRKGDGTGGGPLLLTGHTDVVPADPKGWTHPPFAAEIADGWLYGRGALDMKHHVAACAMVMRELSRQDVKLKRDVIFAAVADEEASCQLGSIFLVEQHPELVRAEYALGEGGGFTFHLDGKRLYPIQVAHKGLAWLTMRAQGATGHGSVPRGDTAPLRLARAALRLGNMPLPVKVTPAARRMLAALAKVTGIGPSIALRLMASPALADFVLESLISDEEARRLLSSVLRNTASVTGLRSGASPNVFPAVAEATLDGRLLPGQTTADLLRQLEAVVEDDQVTFEILHEAAGSDAPVDTPLFERLCAAVRAMDPGGEPYPQLVPGFTDAGPFSKLGIHTYGFTPMVVPEGTSLPKLGHAVDERIPVEGYRRGLQALWDVVVGFCS